MILMVSNYMPVELQCLEGDSMALFHMLADWKSDNKPKIFVASIDHGLRPEMIRGGICKKICEKEKVEHTSLSPATHLSNVRGNLPK